MIDEKILLQQLNNEYHRISEDYFLNNKNPYYAAELCGLETAINIVREQKKIRIDPAALPVNKGMKNSFPQKLLDEWDSVRQQFRG